MGWFRAKKQKELPEKETPTVQNAQTDRRAASFRFCKFASLAICAVMLTFGIVFFDSRETVDTLRYLVKNLSGSEIIYGVDRAPIAFDVDSSVCCDSFRGDIAVVQKTGVALYDTRGKLQYRDNVSFSAPVLMVANDVFLAYDLGGNTLRVYNAFSNVFSLTLEYPIFGVSLHENGTFAVATSEQGYHAAVQVYDAAFQCVFKWRSPDKLVMDIALSPDDDTLLLVGACKAEEGDFASEMILLSTRSDKPVSTVSLPDSLAMLVAFSGEEGGFSVLTDTNLSTVSKKGEVVSETPFTSTDLAAYYLGKNYSVLARKKSMVGSTYGVQVVSPDGEMLFETDMASQIFDIEADGDVVYVLAYETLYVLHPEEQKVDTYTVSRSFREIFPMDKDTLAFVSDHTVCFMLLE